MSRLVIFDIDGTLVNSSQVDEECFVRAAEDAFGIRNIDTRWELYRHATDGAIFEEVFETAFGRRPTEAEVKKQIKRFLHHLKKCRKEAPELFREVSGASQLLHYLTKHPQWKPAIATGTWKKAALLKLEAAGLDVGGIPLATSSDAHSREEIIRKCISRNEAVSGAAIREGCQCWRRHLGRARGSQPRDSIYQDQPRGENRRLGSAARAGGFQ